ncbi:MAG TPA: chromosomal replication initiator protein DnaA [Burkholderiales bacterium]|nr:chromosomal replication initiator protein DnaA [Burkholderiales bacterium]
MLDAFWVSCLDRFEHELPSQQFNTWIKPLRPAMASNTLTLTAPNRFVLQWIKDKFVSQIEKMASDHFAHPVVVVLALPEKTANTSTPFQPASVAPKKTNNFERLNPDFSFDNFVTGRANQMARAAALQVAENSGAAYNPLFVYGGVGLGKTHLIQAIGNYVRDHNAGAKIRYIHAEQYVSDVVRAVRDRAFDEFKRYYHSLDLLLVDDIQFFGGKPRTQEEFFYTFNALTEYHKQVVLTCDCFPKEISNIEGRLVSRFGWGLTVAVEPPELEMRVAILQKKAAIEECLLAENVAFFIAKHIQSNVRELEGALKRVLAYSRFSGLPITLQTAREALQDILAAQSRLITIDNIQRVAADFYKVKVTDMYSKKRPRSIALPRQIAMALAKELTQLSLPDIGEAFGGRDHTTVLHACRKIAALRASDNEFAREINVLIQSLRS